MYFQKKRLFTITCLLAGIIFFSAVHSYASDTSPVDSTQKILIDRIIINGNEKTKSKIILLYMDLDSGDIYDTSKISLAESNLLSSGLFKHVKILPVTNQNKATLLVTLRENQYFKISDIGGVIYNSKYGEPVDGIWIHAYSTLTFGNFRGRNESLDISGGLWTIRYLGFSWYKPFISSPYYIRLGSTIGSAPSIVTAWHLNFFNSSFATLGREIGKHSKVFSTVQGRYLKYTWEGGDGQFKVNDKIIKKLPYDTALPPFERDTTWMCVKMRVDTMGETTYTYYSWLGYSDEKIKKHEDPFTELLISLGWMIDKRNEAFDPHKGFYFSTVATTNALWPYEDISLKTNELRYLQLNFDFRFFHRGIWESNTVAYKINPLIRLFGKGNIYSGLYMGSESSLRGYGHGAFGSDQYNHRVLFSWEYRFPIVKLPEMRFPWLAWYDKSLNNLQTRIDGAFILDYGYIWKDLSNLQHPNQDHRAAAGTGFGFRFMFPGMKRSACAEIVWPVYPEKYATAWPPAVYLYLDLPF